MRSQAYEPGRIYALRTHRWKGERYMEFLRKDDKGRLVFALPPVDSPMRTRLLFENKFRPEQILTSRRADLDPNGEEVVMHLV